MCGHLPTQQAPYIHAVRCAHVLLIPRCEAILLDAHIGAVWDGDLGAGIIAQAPERHPMN
jgi:hypothetical protein